MTLKGISQTNASFRLHDEWNGYIRLVIFEIITEKPILKQINLNNRTSDIQGRSKTALALKPGEGESS